jgi:hypothetical protein
MQKWVNSNIAKIFSLVVAILVALDGFFMLGFGIIHSFMVGVGDPAGPGVDKRVLMFRAEIVLWLTFAYLVICLICLMYWLSRRGIWRYVILGLGILPIVGPGYFLIMSRDFGSDYNFARYPFWSSLATNLPLIAFVILDTIKSKSVRQEKDV